ncbi:hypothetical protein [Streptomyces sp. NPDC051310]|uniref:hypothetical protein n=1 Tax=Streptomyces sp. NPDC051310 TaxID=3365649 RepID=UPI003794BD38
MGYKLRRQLREALGPGIAGLQRAVALEIADDASDVTRESAVTLEELVRWTAAKDTDVVRNALKRLALAGWELRVPIGKGKDGRTLYAVPGRRMTFRIPDFEGVATATPEEEQGLPHGGAGATPQPPEGVAGASSEGAGAHSEGAGATPSSFSPSPLKQEEAPKRPDGADEYGIPDVARPLVDALSQSRIRVRWPFKGDGWFPVIALITKCGIPAMVDHATRAVARNPQIDSARYFMRGWGELPPKPADGTPHHLARPHLRAVGQTPEERGIF